MGRGALALERAGVAFPPPVAAAAALCLSSYFHKSPAFGT